MEFLTPLLNNFLFSKYIILWCLSSEDADLDFSIIQGLCFFTAVLQTHTGAEFVTIPMANFFRTLTIQEYIHSQSGKSLRHDEPSKSSQVGRMMEGQSALIGAMPHTHMAGVFHLKQDLPHCSSLPHHLRRLPPHHSRPTSSSFFSSPLSSFFAIRRGTVASPSQLRSCLHPHPPRSSDGHYLVIRDNRVALCRVKRKKTVRPSTAFAIP